MLGTAELKGELHLAGLQAGAVVSRQSDADRQAN